MDFANRGNRPVQQATQPVQQTAGQQVGQAFQAPEMAMKSGKMDFTKIGTILMVAAGILLLGAIIVGLMVGGKDTAANQESSLIKTGDNVYQAVFLDSQDGQVYFGKLEVYNRELYRLTDIFYVRVEQPLQPEGTNQQSQANISLAKLGNELHGPEDEMFISRDNVLYWENLKSDGQVGKAIADFIANGRQTPAADQTQQSTTPVTQP